MSHRATWTDPSEQQLWLGRLPLGKPEQQAAKPMEYKSEGYETPVARPFCSLSTTVFSWLLLPVFHPLPTSVFTLDVSAPSLVFGRAHAPQPPSASCLCRNLGSRNCKACTSITAKFQLFIQKHGVTVTYKAKS